jgi:hypothetical protein
MTRQKACRLPKILEKSGFSPAPYGDSGEENRASLKLKGFLSADLMRAARVWASGHPRKASSPIGWGQQRVHAVKGLIFATLAASLLGSVSALAQSQSIQPASVERSTIGKIAGKTLYAADGSSLTFFAYQGGLAREIHTATGATVIETYALKSTDAGTVSDSEGASPAGTFRITAAGLAADYNDGRSEILASNGAGMRMTMHGAAGDLTCTAFYPEGHRFTDAERTAALIDVSALNVPQDSTRNGCEPEITREAHARTHRHTAQSDETVVARLPE